MQYANDVHAKNDMVRKGDQCTGPDCSSVISKLENEIGRLDSLNECITKSASLIESATARLLGDASAAMTQAPEEHRSGNSIIETLRFRITDISESLTRIQNQIDRLQG